LLPLLPQLRGCRLRLLRCAHRWPDKRTGRGKSSIPISLLCACPVISNLWVP